MPRKIKPAEPAAALAPHPCKLLDEWLKRHGAAEQWRHRISKTLVTECWFVGSGIVLIQRYGWGGADGWGLFTQDGGNSVVDSLTDAEQRLGIAAAHKPTE